MNLLRKAEAASLDVRRDISSSSNQDRLLPEVFQELGINAKDIERVSRRLKRYRQRAMGSDRKIWLSAKMSEWSEGMGLLGLAYRSALKNHKDVIKQASEQRDAPMRLVMIGSIGLLASVLMISLAHVFWDQLALLVGCVTLIFSTFEYWVRKGILEHYLLSWSKKNTRIKFVSSTPSAEETAVALLDVERKQKQQVDLAKSKISAFNDPQCITWRMLKYYHDIEQYDQSHNRKDKFIKGFTRSAIEAMDRDIEQLTEKVRALAAQFESVNRYEEIKRAVEVKVWQCWLEEQNPALINRLRHAKTDKRNFASTIKLVLDELGISLPDDEPQNRDGDLPDACLASLDGIF